MRETYKEQVNVLIDRLVQLKRDQIDLITNCLAEYGNLFYVDIDTEQMTICENGEMEIGDKCDIIQACPYLYMETCYLLGASYDKEQNEIIVYTTKCDDVCDVQTITIGDIVGDSYQCLLNLIYEGKTIKL